MATAPKTATKQTENTAPPPEQRVQQQNAVAVLAPARLPYPGKNILDQFAVKPGRLGGLRRRFGADRPPGP